MILRPCFSTFHREGLNKYVLVTFGINIETTNVDFMPAKWKPISNHVHVELTSDDFNYCSVVEMLLYLAGHNLLMSPIM